MNKALASAALIVGVLAACGTFEQSDSSGSSHNGQLRLPPDRAAACFARNAEEHSSALVAEVMHRGQAAEVVVRVKNGVLYGTGEFTPSGSGSRARLTLMVITTGRRSDLIDTLLEGC